MKSYFKRLTAPTPKAKSSRSDDKATQNVIVKKIQYNSFLLVFIAVIAIRIGLMFMPPFEIDQAGWRFWSMRMVEQGPANFYSPTVFTDNPPGFLYIFWLVGFIKNTFFPQFAYISPGFDFLLKLPTNIADILVGLLIYLIVKRYTNRNWATLGLVLYTLNPAILFNSSVWGQFDGFATLFLLLSLWVILAKRWLEVGAALFVIAWMIKPQAVALAPLLGVLALVKFTPIRWLTSALSLAATTLLFYLPFFPSDPIHGILYVNDRMTNLYKVTSAYAINFWGMFGIWKDDQERYRNIMLVTWGFILFGISLIPLFFLKPFKRRFSEPYIYVAAGLCIFAFFTFMTRMHERYLFPFFAFFLLGALLLKNRFLLIAYTVITLLHLFNLIIPYAYYNKNTPISPMTLDAIIKYFPQYSAFSVALLLVLLGYFVRMMLRERHEKAN